MKKTIAGCLASLLALIVVIIICPVLYYFFGWVTGHILKFLLATLLLTE